jgi:hypothetical protein
MDAPHGPYKVSIWADPDIGEALFYVLVESLQNPEIKVDAEVTLWTRPTSNRLEKAIYQGELQPLRGRTQYVIKSHFDQQDFWNVGVDITGNGKTNEVTFEIESTPDGYGIWDLAIYLFPFALLGGLWIRALFHRHKDIDDESGGGHDQTGEAVQEMSTS